MHLNVLFAVNFLGWDARMRIFFSVGEPSGDQHAAHLIAEISKRNPNASCIGFGGPLMKDAGCRVDYQLTDLAVVGVLRVIPMLARFLGAYRQAKQIMDADKPDAVMLVDFPGFNWWIAKAAKKRGIPVFFYLPPQLWAWGSWRVKRVKRLIDHVMSALQFETDWYRQRDIDCHFVGHPFFDEVAEHQLDGEFMDHWASRPGVRNVGILPGSRNGEVHMNWPVQMKIMEQISRNHPDVRFLVASYRKSQLETCRQLLEESGMQLPVHFFTDKTSEIIELADCVHMTSGSVSLELLARRTPGVVYTRLKWLERKLAPLFIRCKYISLPNLMADREVFPEYLTGDKTTGLSEIVAQLDRWLSNETSRQEKISELNALCDDVVTTGANRLAVDYFLGQMHANVSTKESSSPGHLKAA